MKLTDEDLNHLERLARVRLDASARERLRGQLSRIIEFVERLQSIDTGAIGPAAAPHGSAPQLRRDEIAANRCIARDEALGAAPDRAGSFFGVPPVIETEEP